jgi:hypothetical protein
MSRSGNQTFGRLTNRKENCSNPPSGRRRAIPGVRHYRYVNLVEESAGANERSRLARTDAFLQRFGPIRLQEFTVPRSQQGFSTHRSTTSSSLWSYICLSKSNPAISLTGLAGRPSSP